MLHGLHWLHNNGIINKKIRLEDVLIDENNRAKIRINLENYNNDPFDRINIKNKSYRCGSDMISIGCVAYALCTLEVTIV